VEKINNLKLHIFIVWFGTAIIVITLIVALIFKRKAKPWHFRYIGYFIVLSLLISANTYIAIYLNLNENRLMFLIERVLILFQFIVLGLFYMIILKKSIFIKKIKVLFYLSIIIQITLIIATFITDVLLYTKISSNVFLIIFSAFFYRDLLNNKPTLILIKSTSFWIVTGIFFSYCVSFPVYSLTPFIKKIPEYKNIRSQLFSISNMSLIVMYLFIIKSYLCLKHPQNL
jgi:hypothetical protein